MDALGAPNDKQMQQTDPVPAIASPPVLRLELVPREPRFVVRLPGRISRSGSLPIQLALPQPFHHQLRIGVSGSLNHALIGLVRQALSWLDAAQVSLRIRTANDPLTSRRQSGTDAQHPALAIDLEAPSNWRLPHPAFEECPRKGKDRMTVVVDGRPSREEVTYIQAGLPLDLHQRLHEEGLGSISQLVVYLARYAYMRLLTQHLTLHVSVVDAHASNTSATSEIGASKAARKNTLAEGPITTVGELIQHLRQFPADAPVGLGDIGFDVRSSVVRLDFDTAPGSGGSVLLVGDFQDGIEDWIDDDLV